MPNGYTFPPLIEHTCANGLRIVWVPDHEQEALTVALQMPFGKFSDPAGREGVSELAIALMQKGTKDKSPEKLSEALESTGSSLFSDVGEEHVVLGCRVLSRFAEEVLPLFWEVVTAPGQREAELKILKREFMTALQAEAADPVGLAGRHFCAELFGQSHPAGRHHTVSSVKRLGLRDVTDFCSTHLGPRNACLVVAGHFDPDALIPRWEAAFGGWTTAASCPAPDLPAVKASERTVVRVIDKQDLTQASIVLGHLVPGELHAQRNELALANYILGGGNFSSRLMAQIRSKLGKTYGISSQMSCGRALGTITVSTSTQSSQAAEMLRSILDVYRKFSADGVTGEELDKAKRFAVGNMAFQLEGIGNITEKLLWLMLYGRQRSYIERFPQLIESISLESVNEAIREHLGERSFAIAAVGNQKAISSQLAEFGEIRPYHFRSLL